MRILNYVFIVISLSVLCACSVSPERVGYGVGKWAISKARYQQLVGPSNRIIKAFGKNYDGRQKEEVEDVLSDILADVRQEIINLDNSGIEKESVHDSLPEIDIELIHSDEPYAIAVQGSKPRIELSTKLISNLINPYMEDAGATSAMSDPFMRVFSGLSLEAKKVEILEGLVFVIAHEATHIWLDEIGERTIESEIRADAYGVLISSELSLVADHRRKMMAQMMRTLSYNTSDPIAMIMMQAEIGGEIMLNVYKESKFSDGNESHLPIEERITKVKSELDNILERRANDTSVMESAFWAVVNDVLFE